MEQDEEGDPESTTARGRVVAGHPEAELGVEGARAGQEAEDSPGGGQERREVRRETVVGQSAVEQRAHTLSGPSKRGVRLELNGSK